MNETDWGTKAIGAIWDSIEPGSLTRIRVKCVANADLRSEQFGKQRAQRAEVKPVLYSVHAVKTEPESKCTTSFFPNKIYLFFKELFFFLSFSCLISRIQRILKDFRDLGSFYTLLYRDTAAPPPFREEAQQFTDWF